MSAVARFKLVAEVYLLFRRGETILLQKRANTGYCDGQYGLVSGHVDGGESLAMAAAREAFEEARVRIAPQDLILKTIMHRRPDGDVHERIGFFFEPARWEVEIVNAEPHKCDELGWYPIGALPAATIGYIRAALGCVEAGAAYSDDWPR